MRNLKIQYNKAREWRVQAGLTLDERTTRGNFSVQNIELFHLLIISQHLSIQDYTLRLCPHWDSLYIILGDRTTFGSTHSNTAQPAYIYQSDNSNSRLATSSDTSFIKEEDEMDATSVLNEPEDLTSSFPGTGARTNSADFCTALTNGCTNAPRPFNDSRAAGERYVDQMRQNDSSAPDLVRVQRRPAHFMNDELKFQRDKFQAEMDLAREEIGVKRDAMQLKREKFQMRMDYKQAKLRLNEKLRILDMEKDERLAKYELNLKYKMMQD